MSVDKATGVVYLGDYGPDAGTASANRGPAGTVAFERITQPGFYGWPYCSNYNTPVPRVHVPQSDRRPARVQLRRRADEQLAQQHRHHHAAGRRGRPGCPTAAGRTRRPVLRQPVADGRPGLQLQPGARLRREVPGLVQRQGLRSASSAGRWIKTVTINANGTAGTIDPFPWYRHPGHGHGVRAGRRALRARLRHRLVRRRRQLGRLPHRVQQPAATGRRSPRPQRTRPAAAAPLTVQFSSAGTQRPGRRPDHLRVGLHHQRQHRLDRGQPVVHLHGQRRVHRDADGARHTGGRTPRPASSSASAGRRSRSSAAAQRPAVQLRRRDPVPGHRHRPERPARSTARRVEVNYVLGPRQPRSPDHQRDRLLGHDPDHGGR